jgi:diguanylate cyclase (GGDEF)-like protein
VKKALNRQKGIVKSKLVNGDRISSLRGNTFLIPLPFISILIVFVILGLMNFGSFFAVSLILLGFSFVFYKLRLNIFYKVHGKFDKMEERINLLSKKIEEKTDVLKILPSRCKKISFLFDISQKLVGLSDPEEIYEFLINTSKQLFPKADNILLFLARKDRDSLILNSSLKGEDRVIKEKTGDLLDKWVLRHNYSLLVKDLKNDFRFDYNKVVPYRDRGMSSFIVSPLSVGERIVATVRVESSESGYFTLDDSRLLRSICDLSVVVLERANLFRKTEELSIKDSLTKLFLRNYFFDRLKEEIARAQIEQTKVGILMLDIDDFKKVNDSYGHVVGDLVLKRLAKILEEIVGDTGDVVSRLGGEEFIIFLIECDKERILTIAEEILSSVERARVIFRRVSVNFTVSLGGALYPDDGKEIRELVDKADKRLYQAKEEGKNRVCITNDGRRLK